MTDLMRYGPVFFICQFTLLILTPLVLWLGVVAWETLGLAFVIFGIGGVVIIIMVAAIRRNIRLSPITGRETTVAAIGIIVLIAVNVGLFWLLGLPFEVGPSTASTWYERVLVNVLFAIYEENFMLGIYTAGKAAGIPDLWIVIMASVVFVPLHAWVRALDLLFATFLIAGRTVLTGLYAITDHSDPSYITHIIWNVINS